MTSINEYGYLCPSDECPLCTGEMCGKCGAGCWDNAHWLKVHRGEKEPCEHDAMERRED